MAVSSALSNNVTAAAVGLLRLLKRKGKEERLRKGRGREAWFSSAEGSFVGTRTERQTWPR